jgi:hypothetical protein
VSYRDDTPFTRVMKKTLIKQKWDTRRQEAPFKPY